MSKRLLDRVKPETTQWATKLDHLHDGPSSKKGCGVEVILKGLKGLLLEQSLRFDFKVSNNQAEYESIVAGLMLEMTWEREISHT